jgi:hypothetical protein
MKRRSGEPKPPKPAHASQRMTRALTLLRTAHTHLRTVLTTTSLDDVYPLEEGKKLRKELWVFHKKLEGVSPWLARMRNQMRALEVVIRDEKKLAALGVNPEEVLSRVP